MPSKAETGVETHVDPPTENRCRSFAMPAAVSAGIALLPFPAHADHFLGPSWTDWIVFGVIAGGAALLLALLLSKEPDAFVFAVPIFMVVAGICAWMVLDDADLWAEPRWRTYCYAVLAAPLVGLVVGVAGWWRGRQRQR